MKKYLFSIFLSLSAVAGAGTAQGAECEGVSFPEQIQSADATLQLNVNGLGLRQATFLKIDVYVAALYLTAVSTDANAIWLGSQPPNKGLKTGLLGGKCE